MNWLLFFGGSSAIILMAIGAILFNTKGDDRVSQYIIAGLAVIFLIIYSVIMATSSYSLKQKDDV
mgnify:CR=1 FL=1